MSAVTVNSDKSNTLARLAGQGAIGGLAGGLVFAVMMAMGGMLPMVGMLVGVDNSVVGFIVHMAISAFIGALYGLVAGRFPPTSGNAIIGGLINGVFWWVLGALVLMPLFLGMNEMIFVIGQPQWMSLVGHILYGVVTAFAFNVLAKR
jgi:uncharacterized membrane protein YagU involved in acid resistance